MATETKGTRNGYGSAFHSKGIQNRVIAKKQAQAAVMTEEQKKAKWADEVNNFLSKGIEVTKQQEKLLSIGKSYFSNVRKVQNTLGVFSISVAFVPPTVTDIFESATWITKVGCNQSKRDEFFPNIVNAQLQPIKKEKVYSDNPDDYEEYPDQEIGNNKLLRKFVGQGSLVDPLVVLFYCFYCEKLGDELLKVRSKLLKHKHVIITKYYRIELDLDGNGKKEYSRIVVERK